MSKSILERLRNNEILLADGAMGTELQKRGLSTGECPETYNLSHPETIQAIHKDYYDAGSDIVETNSFGGSRPRLERHNAQDQVYALNKAAAELAKKVCPAGKYVAGSVGPTGEMMAPLGTLTAEDAFNIFAEQAAALAEGGADIIFVETMMAIEEAEIAVKAAKEKTGLPVSATMTFDTSAAGVRTSWGVDVATAVGRLQQAGADVIGSNCGTGVDIIIEVVKQIRELTDVPVLAQPNAGLPEMNGDRIIYKDTPEVMAVKLEELLKLNINILGGCCGTNPGHIRMMRGLLDQLQTNS